MIIFAHFAPKTLSNQCQNPLHDLKYDMQRTFFPFSQCLREN